VIFKKPVVIIKNKQMAFILIVSGMILLMAYVQPLIHKVIEKKRYSNKKRSVIFKS